MPRMNVPALLALSLLATAAAQTARVQQTKPIDPAVYSVRVSVVNTAGGVGVGLGANYLNVACKGNEPVLSFPKSAPRPHMTMQARPYSAASVIVSRTKVVRAIMKTRTAITANLNPLELQFSCQDKKVVTQGGRLVVIAQR